jgi:hypothetical protein
MQSWLAGACAAFASVFARERKLCDRVFNGDNESVRDAVFSAVANNQTMSIFAIAEADVLSEKQVCVEYKRVYIYNTDFSRVQSCNKLIKYRKRILPPIGNNYRELDTNFVLS